MKNPHTILTLEEIIEVLSEYELHKIDTQISGDKIYGYCDFQKRIIYIGETNTPKRRIKTILHEVAHAYNELNNLPDSEKNANLVQRNTYNKYFKNG